MTGPAEVAIDGAAAVSINPDVEGGSVTAASALADVTHTAVVRSPNGPPGVFIVARAQPWPWLWALAPALLLAALVVVGALLMRAMIG